jgi:hypothetical protein
MHVGDMHYSARMFTCLLEIGAQYLHQNVKEGVAVAWTTKNDGHKASTKAHTALHLRRDARRFHRLSLSCVVVTSYTRIVLLCLKRYRRVLPMHKRWYKRKVRSSNVFLLLTGIKCSTRLVERIQFIANNNEVISRFFSLDF